MSATTRSLNMTGALTVIGIARSPRDAAWQRPRLVDGTEEVTAEHETNWGAYIGVTFDAPAGTHRLGQTITVTIESESE